MKVLVIGGTGLIGSHVVSELLARGHGIRVLCRSPRLSDTASGIEYVRGDCLEPLPRAVFDDVEGMVYAAGTDYRILPKEHAEVFFQRTNVVASARLFAEARAAGVKRAVFISSYYHVVRPEYVSHPYVASRRDSEAAVLDRCGDALNLCIIQPAWVLGPASGHVSFGGTFAKWAYSRFPILINRGGTNWVAATSLAHAIATALEQGEHGAKYCIGDENRSWENVVSGFVRALGVNKRVYVAPRAGTLLSGALAAALLGIAGRHPGLHPYRWSKAVMDEVYFDPAPAVQKLGYPTHCIDQAIAAMAQYWRRVPAAKPSFASD